MSYSVGMVLRNENGQFVKGKNMRFQGVEESIRWIEEMRVSNVEIESDSELTVKAALSKEKQYYNEAGHTIEFCHWKL